MGLEARYIEKQAWRQDLALAAVDGEGVVLQASGAWGRHGFAAVRVGARIDLAVDALVGFFPVADEIVDFQLPFIEMPDGRYDEIAVDGGAGGCLVAVRDVTLAGRSHREIVHARNQLQLANATLERLASELGEAMAALKRFHLIYEHEVRNAAQVVQGTLEMLRRRVPELATGPYYQAALTSARGLVDALNAAVAAEKARALQGAPGTLVPAQLVRELTREFSALAQLRSLTFTGAAGPGTETAAALDPFRLRLVLVNLLSNALKFTRRGGIGLRVELDQTSGELIFSVADTGIGMSEGVLGDLATEFASPRLGEGGRAAGLGLYLCNQLTRSLRGRLEAASERGVGTAVRVILPGPHAAAPH